MQTLHVDLGERSYPIYIGQGLLCRSELLAQHIAGRQVAIVTNETVAPLYSQVLEKSLSAYQLDQVVLPDGEGGRAFLAYDNYKVLMHWNRSYYFVTSVGYLADLIIAPE